MTPLTVILALFGIIGLVAGIVFLVDKRLGYRIEQSREWKEVEDVWVDVNSGEIKFYLDDNGNYKLKEINKLIGGKS